MNIYQDTSLQNDSSWKKFEHRANKNISKYNFNHYRSQCNAPISTFLKNGHIPPPCMTDTDSMLRHGLIENPSLIDPEEINKSELHFNYMPKPYEQQCDFKDISCIRGPDFKFFKSTTVGVNPQDNILIFDTQGVATHHYGKKSDNFYKNLDDIQLRKLF